MDLYNESSVSTWFCQNIIPDSQDPNPSKSTRFWGRSWPFFEQKNNHSLRKQVSQLKTVLRNGIKNQNIHTTSITNYNQLISIGFDWYHGWNPNVVWNGSKQLATMKGTKSVAFCTSGLEEHHLTIVLAAMADATFYHPWLYSREKCMEHYTI